MSTADASWSEIFKEVADFFPAQARVFGRRDIASLLKKLLSEVNERMESASPEGADIYLVIHGVHRLRELRESDSGSANFDEENEQRGPNPPEMLFTILREGPELGIHVLVWCDTYTNLKRIDIRGLLGEFSMRVAGPMNVGDSESYLDDLAASRIDKPHRAIFFDEERPGKLEKFRPYGIPSKDWRQQVARKLYARSSTA